MRLGTRMSLIRVIANDEKRFSTRLSTVGLYSGPSSLYFVIIAHTISTRSTHQLAYSIFDTLFLRVVISDEIKDLVLFIGLLPFIIV